MPRDIELEIERLGLLREAPPREAAAGLRKALSDRVNLVAAKAARLIAELRIHSLQPDLLRAFDRLFQDPVTRDPQCWAKNAIAAALRDLEYAEPEPFLQGLSHVQMEAVWGKTVDTAPTLRGICLLSLLPCRALPRAEVMRYLVDGLKDESHTVRVEAVRGLEQMEGEESALLLRLKAHMGDEEVSVVGQVFDSLLKLERDRGVRFVAPFLKAPREVREEAALALGNSGGLPAVALLQQTFDTARDSDFRQVILRAMSISRQEEAIQYLLGLVREARTPDAKAALEALSLHRNLPEVRRLADEAAHQGRPAIEDLFRQLFE